MIELNRIGSSAHDTHTSQWVVVAALLWTAPELLKASEGTGESGPPVGSQKADVYSFAIIMHQIIYRTVAFPSAEHCELIAAKST